jgi:hypothetical protein
VGKICARELHVLGRDAQAPAMLLREAGADIVKIGHGGDVDPVPRHGNHDIGEAQTERPDKVHAALQLRRLLAQQVFARHAEVYIARDQRGGDLRRGEQHHLDVRKTG